MTVAAPVPVRSILNTLVAEIHKIILRRVFNSSIIINRKILVLFPVEVSNRVSDLYHSTTNNITTNKIWLILRSLNYQKIIYLSGVR